MNLHEYQSRDLLSKYNIKFPAGNLGTDPDEIYEIAKKFQGQVVVKAQIHSGGRGKAGGVKLCNSPEEAKTFAKGILGKKIVTDQTDSEGVIVEKLLVTELTNIKKDPQEIYLLSYEVYKDSKRVNFAFPQIIQKFLLEPNLFLITFLKIIKSYN